MASCDDPVLFTLSTKCAFPPHPLCRRPLEGSIIWTRGKLINTIQQRDVLSTSGSTTSDRFNHLVEEVNANYLVPTMGVTGLWDVARPASRSAPLSKLSLEKLLAEPGTTHHNDQRALRIGVDLPAWLFHAGVTPNESKNAKLRTIFFRTLKLLQHGVSLVFVLDGPGKPGQKRGKRITSYKQPDATACEAMLRSLGLPVVEVSRFSRADMRSSLR